MKKLFLALAIFGFFTFGALGIQNIMAATHSIEMVKFDKDPKKDGEKKSKDSKATAEVKAENATSTTSTVKAAGCESSCCGKASTSCCKKEGDDCSKGCPDKK